MTTRDEAPAPRRRLASIKVAAEWLDCNDRTVRRLIRRGELSAFRVGRILKVDLNEVERNFMDKPVVPESVPDWYPR